MPSFTIRYAATPNSPPIGAPLNIEADGLEAARQAARESYNPRSHQSSAGDVRGFWICDQDKQVVASWWEGSAEQDTPQ